MLLSGYKCKMSRSCADPDLEWASEALATGVVPKKLSTQSKQYFNVIFYIKYISDEIKIFML